jgi:hypothetical protein
MLRVSEKIIYPGISMNKGRGRAGAAESPAQARVRLFLMHENVLFSVVSPHGGMRQY